LAKWRIGDASRSVNDQSVFRRANASALLRARLADGAGRRDSGRDRSSAGFTLIELVIVVGVMPLVIGAIAVGILSVFTLQSSVASRLTDSGDAQVVSVNFQNDVQSAALITTDSSAQSPLQCGSGFQVLGLQLGNKSQISYTTAAANSGGTYDLTRNVCSGGSQTPTKSSVIARDLPSSVVSTSPVTVTCTTANAPPACLPGPGNTEAYQNGWVSTVGVTGVSFQTTAPGSKFKYQVVAVPAAGSNTTNLATVASPSTGCGFATPGTGTYAATLCFVDFTPWSTQTGANNISCNAAQSGFSTPVPMAAGIASTPFTLSFCISASPNSGAMSQGGRVGYDDIAAVPLPTYASPPTSEAFLGNNGFYTGVPGNAGLYTIDQGSTATVNITNIQVLNSNGVAATSWELVTGDAESTDTSESITWTSDQNLSLLPNSPNSPIGNACDSTGQYAPPAYNPNALTGVGTKTVACSATVSRDHTGTTMLEATTPSSLTVTLNGTGLQAMFLGVLLP
jgi:hypothetical protein